MIQDIEDLRATKSCEEFLFMVLIISIEFSLKSDSEFTFL